MVSEKQKVTARQNIKKSGESRKAVDILKTVERTHPGEYIVASNLGTAYELSGDLAKAHQWIGEGIRHLAICEHYRDFPFRGVRLDLFPRP